MDYQAALLDPIYNTVGVPAVLTLFDGRTFDSLTVLDKSLGVDVGDGNLHVQTMKPGAAIRAAELATLEIQNEELEGATLLMNGSYWTVQSFKPKPAPTGEAQGEVIVFLKDKRVCT